MLYSRQSCQVLEPFASSSLQQSFLLHDATKGKLRKYRNKGHKLHKIARWEIWQRSWKLLWVFYTFNLRCWFVIFFALSFNLGCSCNYRPQYCNALQTYTYVLQFITKPCYLRLEDETISTRYSGHTTKSIHQSWVMMLDGESEFILQSTVLFRAQSNFQLGFSGIQLFIWCLLKSEIKPW